ncbi:RnfABCDGE type electron transport complex subunit D [Citroniella saccharovorans]|uniref:Ion-translocating oxidoreductase complex subunit D n=1 Tax=Citroniella saccharovorans TaxID=2053367 RepID=A0AAW9MUC1_9FIRM|nr:RnfABCDGE type electron transport complex subunit D [Citroniella saccharovorans]MEB3429453.1 RnfABCDGE type electron transport complex subunit D [Citroniella saccharovorans]
MENIEKKETLVLNNLLIGSSSPHVRSSETVQRIMLDVIIALIPTSIASVYFFGLRALLLIIVTCIAAVVSEALCQKMFKRPVTVYDLSAVVTGMILALNLPVTFPLWKAALGAVFAIVVVKQFFGGLGSNFMNPALAARAMLLASFGKEMSNFTKPLTDMVSQATPLAGGEIPSNLDLFLGNVGGSIGEVSKLAILIGACYLLVRRVIDIKIPLIYILTTFVLSFIFEKSLDGAIFQILAGGLIFGAFFMATDYATTPINPLGQIIFAIGCGVLTTIIRQFGGYPEGVSFSIIIMNICVPLIEKYTMRKTFGTGGSK